MKRILSIILLLAISATAAFSQSKELTAKSSSDYSQFVLGDKMQTWQLVGVASNEDFTALFINITINNNKEGWFSIPETAYISGPFGTMNPLGIRVMDKDWTLGKYYPYDKGNKGRVANVVLYFNRIPAGVDKISYCEPNIISWTDIPVDENPDPVPHTNWNESSLRNYWESNKCSSIEGIYYFTTTSDKNWWGSIKHTLAVIKDGYQYQVIYLKGSNKEIWHEGDLKATFVATASPGLYKATAWYMENRLENEDFYLKFSDGFMSIYENTASITADFLKLYPANDMNEAGGNSMATPVGPSIQRASSSPNASGSGFFVGNKIIATNYHVIKDAKKIEVSIRMDDAVQAYDGRILTTDKTNDLALIIIDDEKFKGVGEIPYTISRTTLDVGASVFTMGYPMANFMGEEVKITDGIISSRTGYEGDIVTYQISAPIQPGSSGGPMFDKNGNLTGVTNAGIISAQNVGYAIKSSYLYNLIESAPVRIDTTGTNRLGDLELTEQIKTLSKFVVYIKLY